MGGVIGEVLPAALGVAISPVPIIAVILMLLSPRATGASVGFMIGWVIGIAAVVTAVALLLDPADDGDASDPSTLSSLIKIGLGVLMLLLAAAQWRSRPPPGEEPKLPGWMKAVDEMNGVRAVGFGIVLAVANPKNLPLCLAGGVTIAGGDLGGGRVAVSIAVFVAIAACSVVLPVLAYLIARDRIQDELNELREWLTANNATVMALLLLVLGVVIVGQGIGGL
jgi:threonine/homoserine/homoserine lactone efflux protein